MVSGPGSTPSSRGSNAPVHVAIGFDPEAPPLPFGMLGQVVLPQDAVEIEGDHAKDHTVDTSPAQGFR